MKTNSFFLRLGAYTTTYRASYTNQYGGNRGGYGQSGNDGSRSANYSKYV